MIEYYGGSNFKAFSDCGLDLGWSHPNATNPPQWPEGGGSNSSSNNSTTGSTGGNQSGNGAVPNNRAIGFTLGAIASSVLASLLF
ncbi:unnamed protein product [Rhizoctonia solani]|uniref:Uncharacterized protein n=1 Tax=Rhizoctonia solani TaxID=456999 RepID=A0A8H3A4L9_9AGAM|nr:unnamed protein product [Rhizoctonia solani]